MHSWPTVRRQEGDPLWPHSSVPTVYSDASSERYLHCPTHGWGNGLGDLHFWVTIEGRGDGFQQRFYEEVINQIHVTRYIGTDERCNLYAISDDGDGCGKPFWLDNSIVGGGLG